MRPSLPIKMPVNKGKYRLGHAFLLHQGLEKADLILFEARFGPFSSLSLNHMDQLRFLLRRCSANVGFL